MKILSIDEQRVVVERFPSSLRLSYETIPHKKVSSNYNVVVAIPTGRKAFVWFTFYENHPNACLVMELNREKQISRISTTIFREFPVKYSLGTILYGTIYDIIQNEKDDGKTGKTGNTGNTGKTGNTQKKFIIEDLYYYKGISVQSLCFGEKLGCIHNFMTHPPNNKDVVFVLPFLYGIEKTEFYECTNIIPKQIMDKIPYNIHHIQYRCLNIISPYMMVGKQKENKVYSNVQQHSSVASVASVSSVSSVAASVNPLSQVSEVSAEKTIRDEYDDVKDVKKPHPIDIRKSQYKYSTIFKCKADMQYDIYHIYAFGKHNKMVYIGITHIPDLETSKMMNSHYRKIRENKNLDYIEESEDEEDFENMAEDRFVNLNKQLNVECVFHMKYRRWVPKRIVSSQTKVIHIMNL